MKLMNRIAFACAFTVVTTLGCQRPSVRELAPRTDAAQDIIFDTERVCSRHDAAIYTQIPVLTETWSDLTRRADSRPIDRDALRAIAKLMRANRERFRDSQCTAKWIANLESSANK